MDFSRPENARRINRLKVLSALRKKPASKAELAAMLQINKVSIGEMVQDMVREGLVIEGGREATGAEIYTQFAGIGIVTADFPTLRRQYCVPDTKRTAKIAMIISRIATLRISLPFPLKLPVNTSITRWLFSLTAIAAPRNMSHTKFILTSSSVHDTGILNTNLQRTWMNVTATRRETKTIRRKLITFVMNAETFSTFTSLERESPPSQITNARFSSRSG